MNKSEEVLAKLRGLNEVKQQDPRLQEESMDVREEVLEFAANHGSRHPGGALPPPLLPTVVRSARPPLPTAPWPRMFSPGSV